MSRGFPFLCRQGRLLQLGAGGSGAHRRRRFPDTKRMKRGSKWAADRASKCVVSAPHRYIARSRGGCRRAWLGQQVSDSSWDHSAPGREMPRERCRRHPDEGEGRAALGRVRSVGVGAIGAVMLRSRPSGGAQGHPAARQ